MDSSEEYPVNSTFYYITPEFKIASFTHPVPNGDNKSFIENSKSGGISSCLFQSKEDAEKAAIAWVKDEISRLKELLSNFKSF